MTDSSPWLVVGLGNPGPTYAGNRHNVGAMVVGELAARCSSTLRSHKARAAAAQVRLGSGPGGVPGPAAVLAVPSTYMNESGGPVSGLLRFFSVEPERLVVVHDELDLDRGTIRLKRGGGEGGHVLRVVAERRDLQPDHVEAVEQIFPERTLLHAQLQVLVRGGNDTHVGLDSAMPANAVEMTVAQHPQ